MPKVQRSDKTTSANYRGVNFIVAKATVFLWTSWPNCRIASTLSSKPWINTSLNFSMVTI